MMKAYMDDVTFAQQGREVRMRKNWASRGDAQVVGFAKCSLESLLCTRLQLVGLLKMTFSSAFCGGALRLRFLLLFVFLVPCLIRGQSPARPDAPTRPAILGGLDKGKYVNHVIGFELQLDPACTFANESQAIAWSTQLPQRLNLSLRCGDNLVVLSSFPLHADEQVNLRRDAQPSLQGVMDSRGFKKHGGWQNQSGGGVELLVQELVRRGDSGKEVGFYNAFMIGRRYVSIFAVGPEANRRELSQAAATLRIEAKTAD
jgi:hypothetical protein